MQLINAMPTPNTNLKTLGGPAEQTSPQVSLCHFASSGNTRWYDTIIIIYIVCTSR